GSRALARGHGLLARRHARGQRFPLGWPRLRRPPPGGFRPRHPSPPSDLTMARRFDTLAVHGGESRDKAHDSLVNPIVLATAYPFENTDELHRYFQGEHQRNEEYGRYGNPTQEVAEAKLAALEGGEAAMLTSTGMSAIITTLLAMVKPGLHLVITADSYRKTRVFVREFLAKFGVEHTVCEPSVDGIQAACTDATRLIVT